MMGNSRERVKITSNHPRLVMIQRLVSCYGMKVQASQDISTVKVGNDSF